MRYDLNYTLVVLSASLSVVLRGSGGIPAIWLPKWFPDLLTKPPTHALSLPPPLLPPPFCLLFYIMKKMTNYSCGDDSTDDDDDDDDVDGRSLIFPICERVDVGQA